MTPLELIVWAGAIAVCIVIVALGVGVATAVVNGMRGTDPKRRRPPS